MLALVGGRSYNQSQFNRATSARRQPGSVFKPFVYLAAFDRAAKDHLADVTPAMLLSDEPTTWPLPEGDWSPGNYDDEYDGLITLRRALALSRNIATIKLAEHTGFDRVAALWKRTGIGRTALRPYPSIALGVFELTPLEVAEAFTVFATLGKQVPPTAITRIVSGKDRIVPAVRAGQGGGRSGDHLPGHQHDAQRAQRGHRPPRRARPALRWTPPARPAPPTTCATPGSSASRRSCWPWSGSASTTTRSSG